MNRFLPLHPYYLDLDSDLSTWLTQAPNLSPFCLSVSVPLDHWLPLSTISRHSLSHMGAMGWWLLSLMSLSLSPSSTPPLHGSPSLLLPRTVILCSLYFWYVYKNITFKHDSISTHNKRKSHKLQCLQNLTSTLFAICINIFNVISSSPLYLYIFHNKFNNSSEILRYLCQS